MNFSANKNIESLNNREYKFLVSLKKNRNRKSSNKSISEGFRECSKLLDSDYEIDTLYFCSDLFIGVNNKDLLDECEQENIRIVKVSEKVFKAMSAFEISFVEKTWQGEPTLTSLSETIANIEKIKPDMIIAIGGGSVIDGAKMVRTYYEFPFFDMNNTKFSMLNWKTHFLNS